MARVSLHLAVLACVLLAGCAAGSLQSETAGCPTSVAYEKAPLPEKPGTFTNESITKFVGNYERALVRNDIFSDADTNLFVNTQANLLRTTETGYLVHVTGSASYRTCTNGGRTVADIVINTSYFVNETTVVRLERPENRTTDLRANGGEVVEQWNGSS